MNQLDLAFEVVPTAHLSDLDPGANDARLVQNAQAGDAESLECLLCKHWSAFCRHAQHACCDSDAAKDICQEACLKAIQCLARFVAGCSFRAWVFAFIDNEAKNWRRNFKKVGTRTQEIDIYIMETMSARAENKSEVDERELLRFLFKRAAQLAQPQRPTAMLMLAHYERVHEFPSVRALAQAAHSSQGAAQRNRRAILASWRHILTTCELEVLGHHRAVL